MAFHATRNYTKGPDIPDRDTRWISPVDFPDTRHKYNYNIDRSKDYNQRCYPGSPLPTRILSHHNHHNHHREPRNHRTWRFQSRRLHSKRHRLRCLLWPNYEPEYDMRAVLRVQHEASHLCVSSANDPLPTLVTIPLAALWLCAEGILLHIYQSGTLLCWRRGICILRLGGCRDTRRLRLGGGIYRYRDVICGWYMCCWYVRRLVLYWIGFGLSMYKFPLTWIKEVLQSWHSWNCGMDFIGAAIALDLIDNNL